MSEEELHKDVFNPNESDLEYAQRRMKELNVPTPITQAARETTMNLTPEKCNQCGGPLDELNDCPECDRTTETPQGFTDLPAAVEEIDYLRQQLESYPSETAKLDRHIICEIGRLFWGDDKQCYSADAVLRQVKQERDTLRQQLAEAKEMNGNLARDLEIANAKRRDLTESLAQGRQAVQQAEQANAASGDKEIVDWVEKTQPIILAPMRQAPEWTVETDTAFDAPTFRAAVRAAMEGSRTK